MELNKTYKRPYKGTQEQIIKRVKMYCKQYNLVYTDLTIYDNYVTFIGWDNSSYKDIVVKLIREKYTVEDELAFHRQRDTKPEEFNIYDSFVEQCKFQAKQFITEREKVNQ